MPTYQPAVTKYFTFKHAMAYLYAYGLALRTIKVITTTCKFLKIGVIFIYIHLA